MKINKAFIGWKIHIFTPRVQDESSIFLLSFLRKWQNLKYVSYKTTFSPSLGLILVYSCWDGAGLMWWRHFKMVLYCLIVYRFPVTTNNVLISVTTESFVYSLIIVLHQTQNKHKYDALFYWVTCCIIIMNTAADVYFALLVGEVLNLLVSIERGCVRLRSTDRPGQWTHRGTDKQMMFLVFSLDLLTITTTHNI